MSYKDKHECLYVAGKKNAELRDCAVYRIHESGEWQRL